MAGGSVFPTTHATWLRTQLAEATDANAAESAGIPARRALQGHLFERYAEPLTVFVRGSSLARLGEPEEIVHGFLVSRLSDARFLDGFFGGWASSGMRLRRWLMNGILFHGQGLARDRARLAARGGPVDPRALDARASEAGEFAAAESNFERAWALAVVREATARAEDALVREGRGDDFEIFRRHAVDGQPYAAFARDFGRSEQQCAGATRLVAQRVRASLAALLREEGVPESELEDEIARVRGVL